MPDFFLEAAEWMHGPREAAVLDMVRDQLASTKPRAIEFEAGELELVSALQSGEMSKIKGYQIGAAMRWIKASENGESPLVSCLHYDCFRDILNMLLENLDVKGFEQMLQLARHHRISFNSLDKVLRISSFLIQCPDKDDLALQQMIHSTGDQMGPESVVGMFEEISNCCCNPECLPSIHAVRKLWKLTDLKWSSTSWAPFVPQLQKIALYASCRTLFDFMNAATVLRDGLFDGGLLHFVRNADIAALMIAESANNEILEVRFGPRNTTALVYDCEWRHGGQVSKVLIDKGCSLDPLLEAEKIHPFTLNRALEKHPEAATIFFTPQMFARIIQPEWLQTAELMRFLVATLKRHHATLPEDLYREWIARAQDEVVHCQNKYHLLWLCCLYSEKFAPSDVETYVLDSKAAQSLSESQRDGAFDWSYQSHSMCSKKTRDSVLHSTLVLRNIADLPLEIEERIIKGALEYY
jgi:hypothetical protein